MLEDGDLAGIDDLLLEHHEIMEKIQNMKEAPGLEQADLIRTVLNEIGKTRNLMQSQKADTRRKLNSQHNRNKINRAYGS